jgi:glycerol kinase
VDREFVPAMTRERREDLYDGWKQAVSAAMGFKARKL